MSNVERDAVLAQLRAEDVAEHLGITGPWRGRWMRSRRCAEVDDHSSDAFGLSREGHWHCWSCDKGGDLLSLLALGERLDIRADFPRVLEIAAGIAGVELNPDGDIFGTGPVKPPPRRLPELAPLPPPEVRMERACRRATWAWDHLHDNTRLPELYLKQRGLDPAAVFAREEIRSTPIRMQRPSDDARQDVRTLWWTMGTQKGTLSIVVPVRSVGGPGFVDLRARRVEPLEGQPKIMGMVGGLTSLPAERGRARRLVGCYGHPYLVDADLVVVCEGLMDYLTALQLWPNAQVLGAVEAGTLGLVAALAAEALAARDDGSRILIVEQADPPRTLKDGRTVPGAADQALNEDANAATKMAVRLLRSPRRVGWLYCHAGVGSAIKDLNDLVRAGINPIEMVTWWTDLDADGDLVA